MPSKRIFFDATPLTNRHLSGVGQVLLETIRVFDQKNEDEVFVFVPLGEASRLKRYGFKHIRVKTLPYPHKFLSLFSRMQFAPPLDIFLGKGKYVFPNFRNWNLAFSKSVTYLHDASFKVYPEFVQAENLAYLNKYMNLWLGRTDAVVAVSETAGREIKEELGVDNVQVVSNAINAELFYPRSKEEVASVSAKWNLPKNYHVFIGNIEPRKNLANLIDGFTNYVQNSKSNDALVIIGGAGWKNEDILQKIEHAQNQGIRVIHPEAYVPDEDLPAIITGARTLIQASWHEGFGLPVLQALACGTPVVVSDIDVLHEVVGSHNDRVAYVKPDDVKGIAKAIEDAAMLSHVQQPDDLPTWQASASRLKEVINSL